MAEDKYPPVCNYEGSDYQNEFWGDGKRAYEDGAEEIALRRILPKNGKCLLEIGAGTGRNTQRYVGFEKIIITDYAFSQVQRARTFLGVSDRFVFVAADVYRLPFKDSVFDGATMIRVYHHLAEPDTAIKEISRVLCQKAIFICEFANKRNLKAIFRWLLRKQSWNPFAPEQTEFVALNYDHHPKTVRATLEKNAFRIDAVLSVSNLRLGFLKSERNLKWMLKAESVLQCIGSPFQLSPSIFLRCVQTAQNSSESAESIFCCPACKADLIEKDDQMHCITCGKRYGVRDGIYDFVNPLDADVD